MNLHIHFEHYIRDITTVHFKINFDKKKICSPHIYYNTQISLYRKTNLKYLKPNTYYIPQRNKKKIF